jgi:probable HAF family extracellular repeat protein
LGPIAVVFASWCVLVGLVAGPAAADRIELPDRPPHARTPFVIHDARHLRGLGASGQWNSVAVGVNERGETLAQTWLVDPVTGDPVEVHATLWRNGEKLDIGSGLYPEAINDRGQVALISVRGGEHPALWENGQLTDIAASGATIAGMNNHGEVVFDEGVLGRLWDRGHLTDLGFTASGGINARGQVIGQDIGNGLAVLWERGVTTDLGSLGGFSAPDAINTRGDVVGYSIDDSYRSHAVLWDRAGIHALEFGSPASYAEAFGINDAGEAVGVSDHGYGDGFVENAVAWRHGEANDLGSAPSLGLYLLAAFAVNEAGQIVGNGSDAAQSHEVSFLWPSATSPPVNLGTLGGTQTSAAALNNNGLVVGGSKTVGGSWHAFLWQNGVMTDLGADPGTPYAVAARAPASAGGQVESLAPALAPTLTPNPGHGRIAVSFAAASGTAWRLDVLDLAGRRVGETRSGTGDGGVVTINSDQSRPGVYWARITVGNGTATRRFVVLSGK